MKERHESRNKNILIGALLAVVLIMGVGYAAFAQQLTINGDANITSRWDVHIKSITPGEPVGTATNVSAKVDSATQATFQANLVSPGDSITYTVVVENGGTLPAIVAQDAITFTEGPNNQAIKYTYSGITAGTTKVAPNNGTATFTVTVTYDSSITEQPEESQLSNDLTMTLNFVQDQTA